VAELEEAVRLAPDSPQMYFSLARAYAKAGRPDDAAQARAKFAELERKRRERRSQEPPGPPPSSVGGVR
jgi:cytochrome c-type biogenesis protein CcmH/NrfG